MLYRFEQFADGHGVVMDSFQVGRSLTMPGIDKLGRYNKNDMFFNPHQNFNLANFVAPDEVSRA